MRYSIAALLVIVSLTCVAAAAPQIGVKGGVNLASASYDPDHPSVTIETNEGLLIGATIGLPVDRARNLHFRGEVFYVQRGWDEKVSIGGASFTSGIDVEEIVVAPFLIYRYPTTGAQPFVEVGPELGFNTKARIRGDRIEDLTDWETVNYCLDLGGGLVIPSGKGGEIVLEGRYSLGLADVYGESLLDINTRGVQLLIGFNFPPPRK